LRFVSVWLNEFNDDNDDDDDDDDQVSAFTKHNITIKPSFFATLYVLMLSINSTRHSQSH